MLKQPQHYRNDSGENITMMPLPSIENATHADVDPEVSRQKAKTLPCRYCQKRFRRLEHVQRHERTHTKEKPFQCSCGKTFGRRDLLVRHEKLVHLNESNKDPNHATQPRPPNVVMKTQISPQNVSAIPNLIDPDLLAGQSANYSPQMDMRRAPEALMQHRAPGCSLDLLSDAATHLASNNHQLPSIMSQVPAPPRKPMESEMGHATSEYNNRMQEDTAMRNNGYQMREDPGPMEDYNMLLDDFGMGSHFFPAIDAEVPHSIWPRPQMNEQNAGHSDRPRPTDASNDDSNYFTRFGNRLPSLPPEYPESGESRLKAEETNRSQPGWKITSQDHRYMQSKLDDFASVLPKGFMYPSRHTLSRYLEGYFTGFHEHLPFLHLPTLSIANIAPELVLALAALGAQFRFEGHRGNGLWYAARAIGLEQVRRRSSSQVLEILSPPSTYRSESAGLSPPSISRNHSIAEVSGASRNESVGSSTEVFSNSLQARLETIQALLFLMIMGTWTSRPLLREALALRSTIAMLTREEGFSNADCTSHDMNWEDWIQIEGEKRTKFIVFCFYNLQTVVYNLPPGILCSELHLSLPSTAKEWKAASAWEWREIRRTSPPVEIWFRDALSRFFSTTGSRLINPPTSTFGNYILITALLQHIFLVRQTSTNTSSIPSFNSLSGEEIDSITNALKAWQVSWERTPESSLDPASPHGTLAFNSTALLRLAYIRLHADIGRYRRLETRDPVRIAEAFKSFPPLQRTPRLGRAILQSAHALSIPVKLGIAFVARTQTTSWSIQHSLCNLECAFLLSKWLDAISESSMDLTTEERNLLEMVRSMLDETEYAVSFDPRDSETLEFQRVKIKQLSVAVVRLWAETFKGMHIFELVKVIGTSLEIYADLLEKANDTAIG